MMKIQVIVAIIATIVCCCVAQAEETYELKLKPSTSPLSYQRSRIVEKGPETISTSIQDLDYTEVAADKGVTITATLRRAQIKVKVPNGAEFAIDTNVKDFAKATENPMARTLAKDLDKLVGTPVSFIVDNLGKMVDRSGLDQVKSQIPGCASGQGLCTQVLLEIEHAAQYDRIVLPVAPVAVGATWNCELPVTIGTGKDVMFPVSLKLDSVTNKVALVKGDMTIDTKQFPDSQLGKTQEASGSVEFTFDLSKGCYLASMFITKLTMQPPTGEPYTLIIKTSATLQPK